MLKLILKPQCSSIINKINNKPHKPDYEATRNIVQENSAPNLNIKSKHKSNKLQLKLK